MYYLKRKPNDQKFKVGLNSIFIHKQSIYVNWEIQSYKGLMWQQQHVLLASALLGIQNIVRIYTYIYIYIYKNNI